MQRFILGYISLDDAALHQFSSTEEADLEAEEWVAIWASDIEAAKEAYEGCFTAWQKRSGLYRGV